MYSNDPYWTRARYASKCNGCRFPIRKGADIFYYPLGRVVMGSSCGCAIKAYNDFRTQNGEAF